MSVEMSAGMHVDREFDEADEPKARLFGLGMVKNAVRSAMGGEVEIAAEYFNKHTKGPLGVMAIARQASTGTMDPSVKKAFATIAKDDTKWGKFCDIIGKGAWITTKSRCDAGLMGLRGQLQNIP